VDVDVDQDRKKERGLYSWGGDHAVLVARGFFKRGVGGRLVLVAASTTEEPLDFFKKN
jgi:hypothetical protein